MSNRFLCALLPLVLLCACGDGRGHDELRVSGCVEGLDDRGTLILQLNGSESLSISSDGEFAFTTKHVEGDLYQVAIESQPERAVCDIAKSQGVVGELLAVTCQGSDASLLDLRASTDEEFSQDFDPNLLDYDLDLSILVQSLRLVAVASAADASIEMNDMRVDSGYESSVIDLPLGSTTIRVRVTAPTGNVANYLVSAKRDQVLAAQRAYVKASNSDAQDSFGYAVAISGDTLVVGARGEQSSATGVDADQADNAANDAGAVYVFRKVEGVWLQEAYLKASDSSAGDRFGESVAVAGDTLVVGAIDADGSGSAYVFERTDASWAQEALLKASNAEAGDSFGHSVSIAGNTIVVGAVGEDSGEMGTAGNGSDNNAPASGAAYVFTKAGTTWSQEAYLKASNTGASDFFGASVSLSGDTLAVGAFGEDLASGAAYIFTRSAGAWSQEDFLKASNADTVDNFGKVLSLSGDHLVVAAPGEDSNARGINGDQDSLAASNSGAVYVFARNGTSWTQEAYIKSSNSQANDGFGSSVAITGDTLAVGATGEASNATGIDGEQANNGAGSSGAVYVFWRTGGSWVQKSFVKASNTEAGDSFGSSIALSADGLAVGARFESSNADGVDQEEGDNNAANSGACYLFQ